MGGYLEIFGETDFSRGFGGGGTGCDSPSWVQGKALVGSKQQSSQKLQ